VSEICPYVGNRGTSIRDIWTPPERRRGLDNFKYKRVRVTCPECGRRLIGWMSVCHDGCCVRYTVPRHKRKGWWKKGKKKSRDRSAKG
jgi:hypothetical protein